MLTKEKFVVKNGKQEWITVPVEKQDIIEYIEKHIKYVECGFKYCSNESFLFEIEFLHNLVDTFNDLGVLTVSEVKKYLHIYNDFCAKYRELKGY